MFKLLYILTFIFPLLVSLPDSPCWTKPNVLQGKPPMVKADELMKRCALRRKTNRALLTESK